MGKKYTLLAAAVALCATQALAAGHSDQVPQVMKSPTAEYLDAEETGTSVTSGLKLPSIDGDADKRFRDAFAKDVLLRVVAVPAFRPEYTVGIKQDGAIYSIFYYSTERCEASVVSDLAIRIVEAWKAMLQHKRTGDPRMGFDGEFYHFTMRSDYRVAGGQTWSPETGTRSAMLVDIADTMSLYCRAKSRWYFAPAAWYIASLLDQRVNALFARLPQKRVAGPR